MNKVFRRCALLGVMTGGICLPSCVITQQTIDFSVFSDAVIPAQNDDVQVEVGRGLSASEVYTAPAAPVVSTGGAAGSYTVLKGDTLSSIARKHNIPLAALYAANGLSEENSGIRDGQKLIIPAANQLPNTAPVVSTVPVPPRQNRSGSYTIAKGDTISSIARRHGISSAELMQANGLTPETADKIDAGQTLNIPSKNR